MKRIITMFFVSLILTSCVSYQPTNISSATVPATYLINMTPTTTCTPTFTPLLPSPTPTIAVATRAPSVTPTPTCTYSLEFYAVAYLNNGTQISYNTPYDLARFLTDDFLDIPGLTVYRNDVPTQGYRAYLAGNNPQRLFLLGNWFAGDTIRIEILEEDSRSCSLPYTLPLPMSVSKTASTPNRIYLRPSDTATPEPACHPGVVSYLIPGPSYPGKEPDETCFDTYWYDDCGNLLFTTSECGGPVG